MKLAIVGRGHWGGVYAKTIGSMPDVSLPKEYICGRNYKEILISQNAKKVDGVIIAASTVAHFEIASYLINQGFKNLLIEKPMTHNLDSALALLNLQKNNPQGIFMAGHIQLYDPAFQVIQKFARNNLGIIKKMYYVSLKNPPTDLTVIQDGAPHPIYIFLDIAKSKPRQIKTTSMRYGKISLEITFDHGLVGKALISTQYPKRKRQIKFVGTKGTIWLTEFRAPRELWFREKNKKAQRIDFSQNIMPLEMQIKEFIDCIKTKRQPLSPISQGVEVVKIIGLAEQSLKTEKEVLYT